MPPRDPAVARGAPAVPWLALRCCEVLYAGGAIVWDDGLRRFYGTY